MKPEKFIEVSNELEKFNEKKTVLQGSFEALPEEKQSEFNLLIYCCLKFDLFLLKENLSECLPEDIYETFSYFVDFRESFLKLNVLLK